MKYLLLATTATVLLSITVSAAKVKDTKFKYGRGFFDAPFDEVITTETSGATIIYTLDGSDPRRSKNTVSGTSPLTVAIDPGSITKRPKTPGVIVRAYAKKAGMEQTNMDTQTYIFVDSVKRQGSASPGGGWPVGAKVNRQVMIYGINQSVVSDARWKDKMSDALKAIPSMSLVSSLDHWFDPSDGLYANPREQGKKTEIPGSLELINPNGTEGFQVNAGIRIRGGYSSTSRNPKHSYRLFFRSEYGDAKLKYPLFGKEGVDEFDKIDLRTSQNHSWAFENSRRNTFLRDIFCRDLQGKSGHHYTKSRYYHIYMNGMYWGIFMTQERAEGRFGASYFGGKSEDYDVIKAMGWMKPTEVTDGTLDLYQELFERTLDWSGENKDYFALLGLKPDGSVDHNGKILVDVDNLIDYILGIFYTGSNDEAAAWGGRSTNNFFCMIDHDNPTGFKFFRHDAEHSMDVGWEDRTAPANDKKFRELPWFNGQTLHERLSKNDEYRMRFADHVYRHFYNGGSMTPENSIELMSTRVDEVQAAIPAEAARWGNTSSQSPEMWQRNIDYLMKRWLPTRRDKVAQQLRNRGLYPDLVPPAVKSNGAVIAQRKWGAAPGTMITLENSADQRGTIFYTTDGTDPRTVGGGVSDHAMDGGVKAAVIVSGTVLKARVNDGSKWSPLREVLYIQNIRKSSLQISEIHYHTYGNDSGLNTTNASEYEFLEIKNCSNKTVHMTGAIFSEGILYSFPDNAVIGSGRHVVLSSNPKAFRERYGFQPFGKYLRRLDNSGEKLVLRDALGNVVDSVDYDDKAPWPEPADGTGKSLTRKYFNVNGDSNNPANWDASPQKDGTPGGENIF
jgi:hypothetical protein